LRKRGAGGQQGDGNPCGDVFCFHDFGWFDFVGKRTMANPFNEIDLPHMNPGHDP
jgi:hypothetical protein